MPPAEMSSTHMTRRYLLWLGILLIVVIGVFVWRIVFPGAVSSTSTRATIDTVIPAQAPAPTDADYAAVQQGFQYLVSYTAGGFSPSSLTVSVGERVRFTNNSGHILNLALAGGTAEAIAPGAYVEIPFASAGSVSFGDGTIIGSVLVK